MIDVFVQVVPKFRVIAAGVIVTRKNWRGVCASLWHYYHTGRHL